MLRLIAGLLAAALFLILFLPVLAVLALIGIKRPDVRERICRKLVNGEFRVISAVCGAHITVRGAENISSGSALYVGNHRSIFDIILHNIQCLVTISRNAHNKNKALFSCFVTPLRGIVGGISVNSQISLIC